MKTILKILGGALVLGALVVGVMVFRAVNFGASEASYAGVELPDPPAYDIDAAAERLGAAIRIKTISTRAGDPRPGQEGPWFELRDYLEATYPSLVEKTTREIIADYSLIYTWEGADPSLPPLILMAHLDVVPINLGTIDDWTHGPFGGVVADGYVWGRGALDDKGALIGLMEAGDALARSGWSPKRTIIFQFGHDEEVSGSGAAAIFAHHKANGVVPYMVLDEGMAVLDDFPLTHKKTALIGVAEKGYMSLKITATTAGGHSSMPPRDSGAVRISQAVLALNDNQMEAGLDSALFQNTLHAVSGDLPFMTKLAMANMWLFKPMVLAQTDGSEVMNALLRTTTAPTMLAGSVKDNVLPQQASAIVNFRLRPGDSSDEVIAHVEKTTSHIEGVSVTPYGGPGAAFSEASPVSAIEGEAWDILAAVASEAGDGAPVAPMLVLGATDARHATAIADTQIYRFSPMVFGENDLALVHGTNERLSVDNLNRMIKGYAQLMMATSGE